MGEELGADCGVSRVVRRPGPLFAPTAGVPGVDTVNCLPMRVTLLTHYYPPEVGAPQARLSALARGLSRRGVEVTVHTGFPHYPDGVIQPPYRNRPWLKEDADGVRVLRSAVYPAPNRGFGRRIANHVSFALSALASSPAGGAADAVIVETPPLLLAGAS